MCSQPLKSRDRLRMLLLGLLGVHALAAFVAYAAAQTTTARRSEERPADFVEEQGGIY